VPVLEAVRKIPAPPVPHIAGPQVPVRNRTVLQKLSVAQNAGDPDRLIQPLHIDRDLYGIAPVRDEIEILLRIQE